MLKNVVPSSFLFYYNYIVDNNDPNIINGNCYTIKIIFQLSVDTNGYNLLFDIVFHVWVYVYGKILSDAI